MINNKKRLYWILQIGGWMAYALLQTVFSVIAIQQAFTIRRVTFFVAEALLCLLITHLFRYYIKKWKWLSLDITTLFPRVLASLIVMSVLIYFLRIPVGMALGRASFQELTLDPVEVVGLSSIYMLLFFLWLLVYFTYHYIARHNKSLKYEASMIESELSNLKSQLNPHFIFNALNSIRALVDENPNKSKQAINQLSNILRNSLAFDKKGLTKFEDELNIVKDYLSLESIRFEERLRTEFDIHPESNNYFVPPFMIQTLVENGVKHGVSKLTEGGVIQVRTTVEKNHLKIQIRNSGHLINGAKRAHSGLGLKNTMQRLKLLYGEEASFKIVNENNIFVLTEITIPQPHRK